MIFPAEFIERVREASDILDVVGQYVSLKKRGANYLGLCPFHNDKSPSFSVVPAKGIFHCFGCGVGGNVFSFIMEREKMNFPEAVEFLAKRANLEIPRIESRDRSAREKLFNAVLKGHQFFRQQYKKSPEPGKYLQSRNFSREIAEKMELGYAPVGWDNFTKTLKSDFKDYVSAGLIRTREKGGGYYDYFRSRLIFPIKDLAGRVCAFGGRLLGEEDEHNPKYLNSPENQIYSKGSLLYALGQNREAIRRAGFAYLVEGYTDLLRLLSCGVLNSAAGLGTAFTNQQSRLLRRYTQKAILIYDGDEAGSRAAINSGRILSASGLEVEIVALPPEHDPDTFLREFGAEGLERSPKLSLLRFQYRFAGKAVETRQEREKLAREMLESAAVLPGEMKRSLALEEISEMVEIPVKALHSELRNIRRRRREEDESSEITALSFSPAEIAERDLVRLLVSSPRNCDEVFPSLNPNLITHPVMRNIFDTMKSLWLKEELKSADELMNQFENREIRNFIAECAVWEKPGNDKELIDDYMEKFETTARKTKRMKIQKRIKEAESRGEDISEFLRELQELNNSQ